MRWNAPCPKGNSRLSATRRSTVQRWTTAQCWTLRPAAPGESDVGGVPAQLTISATCSPNFPREAGNCVTYKGRVGGKENELPRSFTQAKRPLVLTRTTTSVRCVHLSRSARALRVYKLVYGVVMRGVVPGLVLRANCGLLGGVVHLDT